LEFNVPFQHKYGYIRDELGEEKRTKNKEKPQGKNIMACPSP